MLNYTRWTLSWMASEGKMADIDGLHLLVDGQVEDISVFPKII